MTLTGPAVGQVPEFVLQLVVNIDQMLVTGHARLPRSPHGPLAFIGDENAASAPASS